ncbi:SRA-YDG, PUA-like domain protein [Artemisia annua]|uniref:SRA-YDG, PUA-like domain protein n=1 Tax=Artemisia annua TaxID=35608 RepID=A0A2U1Q649_ARTAN|nr:SRA-YDG, PUA-like domain protein [Artemisia annua]
MGAHARKPKVTTIAIMRRIPLKKLNNIESNHEKMTMARTRWWGFSLWKIYYLHELTIALQKKTIELALTRKEPINNANECESEAFRKPTRIVSTNPLPKIKTEVQVVRDFPPGCGIPQDSFRSNAHLNSFMGLNDDILVDDLKYFVDNEIKSFNPPESRRNNPNDSRPAGKVKFLDPSCLKKCDARKPFVTKTALTRRIPLMTLNNIDSNLRKTSSQEKGKTWWAFILLKIINSKGLERLIWEEERALLLVQSHLVKLSFGIPLVQWSAQKVSDTTTVVSHKESVGRKDKGERIANWRVPKEFANIVQQKLKLMEPDKLMGSIYGIQVGDTFRYRSQLHIVGLHCQPQTGIDYTKINEKNLAISIVDSHLYSNKSGSCDMMIYCGQGGLRFLGCKLPLEDQKLSRGSNYTQERSAEGNGIQVSVTKDT